ncbi:MAG: DUF853 family protein, partial [Bauldia sp.]|nr:DUF853 family protein [Bauldia sp.]
VLSQLGNRVQHALRAFTPRDTKAVKTAADTFRPNPDFSTFEVITQLGVGEALVSTLETKGVPSVVQRTLVRPPSSRMGTITEAEREVIIFTSPIGTVYDVVVDRMSAYEMLKTRVEGKVADAPDAPPPTSGEIGVGSVIEDILGLNVPRNKRLSNTQKAAREVTRGLSGTIGDAIGGSVGRQIFRNILGGILKR